MLEAVRLTPRVAAMAIAMVGASILAPQVAAADERVEFLIKELKTNDDFRVRTQAALSLGASKDDAAVQPLCGALEDSSEVVRGASASALGKLGKKDGLPCLKARDGNESNASVKSQITRAIAVLSKDGGGAAVPANAKVYVSVGKTNNKTGRPNPDVDALVREAMSRKLASMDGYAVAPAGESAAAAKRVVEGKGLKGFQLLTTVDAPKYDGDKLTVTLRVVMTTYPGKDIKGEFSPRLTQSGTSPNDKESEDTLIKMAIERAIESFGKVVASM